MCEWRLRDCTCASGSSVTVRVRVEAVCDASGGYVTVPVQVEAT